MRLAAFVFAIALGAVGCSSSPPPRRNDPPPARQTPDPGPTRRCGGCGADVMDPNIAKCPTCDYPLDK